jgi:hypothetical protein
MANWKIRLLGLGIPCLLAFLLDSGLTLHGQPAQYWAGNYNYTNEGWPLMRRLFMMHPLAVVGGYAVWVGMMFGLLILLPEVIAVILSIAIVFGHTAGAYTWLIPMGLTTGWYQTANGMFLVSAILLGIGIRWTVRAGTRVNGNSARHMSPWLRWGLILLFLAVGCSMIFVPW